MSLKQYHAIAMGWKQTVYTKLSGVLSKRNLYINKSLVFFKNERLIEKENHIDYIRYATLELCRESILEEGVSGSIGELGVFKGQFARQMSLLFPDRPFYLFDTFEGFAMKDSKYDREKGYSGGDQDFSDTSVRLVLSKMINPGRCIIKKGFFPDTAAGVEDDFSLVSIDTDLYQPIFNGLEFFYPRLQSKGYILVHDFNNQGYAGAKAAVMDFCNTNKIHYVPLPDACGTAIITK